jgi:hypothetical protein
VNAGSTGDRRARQADRAPAECVRYVGHRDHPRCREVVQPGLPRADHAGAQRGRYIVDVHNLKRVAKVGKDSERAERKRDRQVRSKPDLGQDVQGGVRLRSTHERRTEHVGLDTTATDGNLERTLELGLLRGVIELGGAACRRVLRQRTGRVGLEAVSGDARGVDDAPAPGGDGRTEDRL